MARKYLQGIFKPRHREKYKGNVNNIVYRSGYELKVMHWLDRHSDVVTWSSEEMVIPYLDRTTGKIGTHRRYFPDFVVERVGSNGNKETLVIEVKPYNQTIPPVIKNNKIKKNQLHSILTYAKNKCKWDSAEQYCKARGYKFILLTEKEINSL